MFEKKTAVDDKVIIQGDDGDNFYVIDKGIYDIYVKIDGTDKKVTEVSEFHYFTILIYSGLCGE